MSPAAPKKPKILTSIEWFTPAFEAGGIISSLAYQIQHLHGTFEFWIVCGNRDLINPTPLEQEGQWIQRPHCKVKYITPPVDWNSIIDEVQPDSIYINGLFNGPFNRHLLSVCNKRGEKTILASHGMLAPNAIAIKRKRKTLWILTRRLLGAFHNVKWHATSKIEANQILQWLPSAQIHIAQNLPPGKSTSSPKSLPLPNTFLSVGRVHPIKNYGFAAKCMAMVANQTNTTLVYQIAGPVENEEELQRIKNHENSMLKIEFLGIKHPEDLPSFYQSAQCLLAPSLTENFGQVIAEALAHGLPCLVSDQTPWSQFPPSESIHSLALSEEIWIRQIQNALTSWNRKELSLKAKAYFSENLIEEKVIQQHTSLFS